MKTQIDFKKLKNYMSPKEFISKYNLDVKLTTFIYRLKSYEDTLVEEEYIEFIESGKQKRIHIINADGLFELLKTK